MAPENFVESLQHDVGEIELLLKNDIWALGVVAYQLATLELPFDPSLTNNAIQNVNIMQRLFSNESLKPEPISGDRFNDELARVIDERLMVRSPKSRSVMADVLGDAYFNRLVTSLRLQNVDELHGHVMETKRQLKDVQGKLDVAERRLVAEQGAIRARKGRFDESPQCAK